MRIALFGATGFSGRAVLEEALARGHEVKALVRNPAALDREHDRLTVVAGNALVATDIESCTEGADAVVHCLGVGGKGDGKPSTLVSDSVALVLDAMRTAGIRRIICMSNVGAGGSGPWLVNRVMVPLLFRWLMPLIDDKDRMEAQLASSDAAWVALRFPNIVDGPPRPTRMSIDGRGIGLSITTGSVAVVMLDQLASDELVRSAPSVSN